MLVEGNVERLLLPQMIANAAPRLQSTYLTVLEIGGAFGYRFKTLIEFLGLTALIITDLDSVFGPPAPAAGAVENGADAGAPAVGDNGAELKEEDDDDEDAEAGAGAEGKPGKVCVASHPGAVTSNQTLRQWLPRCGTVAMLWEATDDQKTQARSENSEAIVRVAYQCRTNVTWAGETQALAGRTLEEAFALENLAWCQDIARKPLQLRIARSDNKDLAELTRRIHRRVQAKSFSKTDFALALLAEDPTQWSVPTYIAEGLRWLEGEVAPPAEPDDDGQEEQAVGDPAVAAVVA